MKSLKKRMRDKRAKAHGAVGQWLRPKFERMGTRLRLKARIRLANRWAAKHPKRFAWTSIGVLAFLFLTALIPSPRPNDANIFANNGIMDIQPAFSGLNRIHQARQVQTAHVNGLISEVVEAKEDLDSLLSLPVKTARDSAEIVSKYRKIKIITQTLNDNNNEKN